jgi:osmotically-inducible protein OsmY
MLNDTQIRENVTWQLRWDARCRSAEIASSVDDGVVTLSGVAHDEAEHQAARRAALRAIGVIDLADDIAIVAG